MIEERALVHTTEQDYAWVSTQRQSTCGQCQVQKGCGTSVFAKVLGNKFSQSRALNKINAKSGDVVILGLKESVLIKSALMMYMLPLISLFVFGVTAKYIDSVFNLGLGEFAIIISAMAGLLFAFMTIRRVAKRYARDPRYQPVILRFANMVEVQQLHPQNSK